MDDQSIEWGYEGLRVQLLYKKEKHEQLINEWRQVFYNIDPDCVLGPVCNIATQDGKLPQICETTKQAYENQQAQQLRGTLRTH